MIATPVGPRDESRPGVASEAGDPGGSMTPGAEVGGDGRSWPRVLGLFILTLMISVVEPLVLVGIPYLMLLLGLPTRRLSAMVTGALVVLFVFGGGMRGGMWYAERGWAILTGGWFLALTLRWPAAGFTTRALGAVSGAAAVAAGIFLVRPGAWTVLDWLVEDRVRSGAVSAMTAFRALRGEENGVSAELSDTVYRTAELQAQVFPALVGLASVAALGVAWWVYNRLSHGSDGSEPAGYGLGPVQRFRFNDQLVWLFIGGLGLLLAGGEGVWNRAGSNAVVFMGAFYALRGAAVVLFFNGGLSLFGFALLALGLLFLAPVILVGALVVGLGDTWLDLRERAREVPG